MAKLPSTPIPGSYKAVPEGIVFTDADKQAAITVTVRLRRKNELPAASLGSEVITRAVYENDYAASQEDADDVEAFAHEQHLSTLEVNLARRSIMLTGTIHDFSEAFGVTF